MNDARPKDDLTTTAAVTWCPGCGNFGILDAFKKAIGALEGRGVPRERLVMAAGIGQHAKIFDHVALSGFYSLHGRAIATAQGIKLANPDLSVITFVGDGDTMGEGIEHLIFAAKRNSDITVLVHDNGVYALTTGQRAPTSARGYRGPSTPHGNVEDPLNPLVIALEAGATFVARGYSARKDELAALIVEAVLHKGFSFIDVLQPCVTFNNTYAAYEQLTEPLSGPAATFEEALALARRQDRLPLGVFYRAEKQAHEAALLGELNPVVAHPSRDTRLARVASLVRVTGLALAALVLSSSGGCAGGKREAGPAGSADSVEITEYAGVKLDPYFRAYDNSIEGPQTVDGGSYRLEIRGLVESPRSLRYDEVLALPHVTRVATLYCVEGWKERLLFEGVRLADVLAPAGPKADARTLILHAVDGYSTALPYEDVERLDLMLAAKINGKVLDSMRGFPFQLVAESKLGYKWVKWVNRIELSDEPYLGFWEERGYSDEADVPRERLEAE